MADGRTDLRALSRLFAADAAFVAESLREGGEPDLRRLRRLQRICAALDVQPDVAALIADLADRVAELERRLENL